MLALALAIFLERLKIQYTLKVFAKSGEKTTVKAMDAIQMYTCTYEGEGKVEEGRERERERGERRKEGGRERQIVMDCIQTVYCSRLFRS